MFKKVMFMEISIYEALNQAIMAQKTGNIKKAEIYYAAILKKEPDHPDVNHNMGVLAYTIGKVEPAIGFFKKAIENNPNVTQYWLSYINMLIEQNRMIEANETFEKACEKGITKDPFGEIKQKLGKLKFHKKYFKDAACSPKYFTTGTVAEIAGIHRDTLLRWLRTGLIPEPKRDRKGWRKFTPEETNAILLFAEGGESALFDSKSAF